MKKRIGKILLGILILIVMFSFYIVKADEEEATTTTESENKTEVVESENKAEENVSKQTVTSTEEKKDETNLKEESFKAKVIEAGESYERDNGNGGKETVQDVKVKILEGKNKDEKFSTTYVLTYDLDNKIIGYKENHHLIYRED